MRPQKGLCRGKTPINVDGSYARKEDRRGAYLDNLRQEIISPHPDSKTFDGYLSKYQDDINRIVGKFRYSTHQLTHDEVVSEANLSLIRKRDEILTNFDGEFDEVSFKKLAYRFVRNVIKWTHWRIVHSSYVQKRTDLQHSTEDGFKSTYELAVETNGYEEEFYEDFDRATKCEFLLKMVKEYSGILTDGEVKVLSFLEKGLTQDEIAEKLGVTHQAISCASIKIFDKIKAHFGSQAIKDDTFNDVSKGHKAISDFFNKEDKNTPMENEDRGKLKNFLLQNARGYTSSQASKAFLNGKYNHQQIVSFSVKNKLTFCLIKSQHSYKFSKDEEQELLRLLKNGVPSKNISAAMNIPVNSVSGKKGHFVRMGLLEPLRKNEAVVPA
jgi:RNA polymerase sigma factor (sigma-70 family)